jgi:CheY-like chemotaxis protein
MKQKWIILAEDDADDRMIFAEAFESFSSKNFQLETLEDGLEVVNYLKGIQHEEDLPQLFVLDQNMPKMTGKATLVYLKQHDRYKHIPVIIYTTYPDEILVQDFHQHGAEAVISKPDTFDGFKQMVHSFFNNYLEEQLKTT